MAEAKANPLVSVIVPARELSPYLLADLIPALSKQTYQQFELLIVLDEPVDESALRSLPEWAEILVPEKKLTPPEKRDLAAHKAQGEILALIDDDAFPKKDWLQQAVARFDPQTAVVCGPGITPKSDGLLAQVSGWFWQSFWGGGPTVLRSRFVQDQLVDDYPTFNFIIDRQDFLKVGGFNCQYWPGEDTKLCLSLITKLNKQIRYSPAVQVFHHRRPIFTPHLRQAGRYGRQRGRFARLYPQTSAKWYYFLPALFLLGLLLGPLLSLVSPVFWYLFLASLTLYGILLSLTAVLVWVQTRRLLLSLLLLPTVFVTHLYYGAKFIQGFLQPEQWN